MIKKALRVARGKRIADRLLRPKPSQTVAGNKPKLVGHEDFWNWLGSAAAAPGTKVLEVGSRAVSSDTLWKSVAPEADYTGFDYLDGKNVDVVGDAHELSAHFDDESFDVIISTAVFEHLAMPWVAVEEISKVLKVGGHVAVETHFSFSEHEMPWNFFQYHYQGLKQLFCEELGFEIVDAGFSNPLVAWFSDEAAPYLRGQQLTDIYCHSNLLAVKKRSVLKSDSPPFDWRKTLSRLRSESSYPERTSLSAGWSPDAGSAEGK